MFEILPQDYHCQTNNLLLKVILTLTTVTVELSTLGLDNAWASIEEQGINFIEQITMYKLEVLFIAKQNIVHAVVAFCGKIVVRAGVHNWAQGLILNVVLKEEH